MSAFSDVFFLKKRYPTMNVLGYSFSGGGWSEGEYPCCFSIHMSDLRVLVYTGLPPVSAAA